MPWFKSDDGFPEHPKSDALAEHFGADWPTLKATIDAAIKSCRD